MVTSAVSTEAHSAAPVSASTPISTDTHCMPISPLAWACEEGRRWAAMRAARSMAVTLCNCL